MSVVLVRDLPAARLLAEEWAELADACDAGPFARPDYALPWWEHLGQGRLLIAVVREDDQLLALAPLHERRLGPVRVARWLGHGLGTIAEALVRPGHEWAAVQMWQELARPGRLLQLLETRSAGGGVAQLLDPATLPRHRVETSVRDECPVTDLEGDGLEVVRSTGSRNLRKQLKSAEKQVAATGSPFTVEVATDVDRFDELLPTIRGVFDLAEEAQPRQHLLRPPYDGFVTDSLRAKLSRQQAVVFVGYLGTTPVSFNLAFRSTTTLSLWIARFDPAYSACRPGHLLTRAAFEWAASDGLVRVDQLLGLSQYKRQWSTHTYDTLEITVGKKPTRAMARAAVSSAQMARTARARVRS